jgi:hypothetical protein
VELPALFRLALLAGQDDRAAQIGVHWTQVVGHRPAVQGEALLRQLQWVAETRPRTSARRRWMRQYVEQLRALGDSATEEYIGALYYLQGLYKMSGDLAQQLSDVRTMHTVIRALPMDRQKNLKTYLLYSWVVEGQALFQVPFDLSSPQLHTAVEHGLAQAIHEQNEVGSSTSSTTPPTFEEFMHSPDLLIGMHVVPARPLTAQHWYGRPDPTATYPRRGVTTVILPVSVCRYDFNRCARIYVAWRRLYSAFASRGVDFILMATTTGSFGMSTRLPPAAEVDSLRAYFRDRLKLPGILGIQEASFETLADHRKIAVVQTPVTAGIVTRDGLLWPEYQIESGTTGAFEVTKTFLANQVGRASGPPAATGQR